MKEHVGWDPREKFFQSYHLHWPGQWQATQTYQLKVLTNRALQSCTGHVVLCQGLCGSRALRWQDLPQSFWTCWLQNGRNRPIDDHGWLKFNDASPKQPNGCGNVEAALLETLCERKEERVLQLQTLLQDTFLDVNEARWEMCVCVRRWIKWWLADVSCVVMKLTH